MKKKDKDVVKVMPNKKKHVGIIVLIIIIAIFLIVRGVVKAMTPQNMAVVSTAVAIIGDIEEQVTTSGTIVSEEQKVYYASISATVDEVPFSVGDVVKEGDFLLTYNMYEMEKELTKAYLQLEASNSSYNGTIQGNTTNQNKLTEARTNLAILNQQIADNQALLKELQTKLATMQREDSTALANKMLELQTKSTQLETLITEAMSRGEDTTTLKEQLQANSIEMSRTSTAQQTFGNADSYVKLEKEITVIQEQINNYEKYKAEMETQKAATENSILDTYQKEEISANNQIAQLTFDDMADTYQSATVGVLAEFEGIITECNVGQGSAVIPGTQLFTLQSSTDVKVQFLASKYDLQKLKIGQKGIVTILGNQYEGEVSKINRAATTGASGTPMVGIEMHIVNPDDRIILGLDAKLEIVTNISSDAILVPVEAINADKEGDFLYVNENGVVAKKAVVCGISSDTYVEIKDGIAIGDEIIVSALTNVEEGMTTVVIATE